MSAADELDPGASLWNFNAVYLREQRKLRDMSQSEIGKIIGADRHRVAHLEAGRERVNRRQAEKLDRALGTHLVVLLNFAEKVGEDENWAQQLWDFEKDALDIKGYVHGLIPVPFQTEDYARELLRHIRVVRDIDASLRKRMARTELLLGQLSNMSLWTLIDERALEPPLNVEMRRAQLESLLEHAERASIRVLPDTDWHAGTDGSFELITTEGGTDVAYMWAQLGGRLVHEASDVRELALRFDRLGARALSEDGSRDLITQKLENLQ